MTKTVNPMIAVPIPNLVIWSKKSMSDSSFIPVTFDKIYWQFGWSDRYLVILTFNQYCLQNIISDDYTATLEIKALWHTYNVPLSEQHWGKYLASHIWVGSKSLVTNVLAKVPNRTIIKGNDTPPQMAPVIPMKIKSMSVQLANRNYKIKIKYVN